MPTIVTDRLPVYARIRRQLQTVIPVLLIGSLGCIYAAMFTPAGTAAYSGLCSAGSVLTAFWLPLLFLHRQLGLRIRKQLCIRRAVGPLAPHFHLFSDASLRCGKRRFRFGTVLIGPCGLFLIECDLREGTVTANPGGNFSAQQAGLPLLTHRERFASPARRAQRKAARLEQALRLRGFAIPVQPVVIFPCATELVQMPLLMPEVPLFITDPGTASAPLCRYLYLPHHILLQTEMLAAIKLLDEA